MKTLLFSNIQGEGYPLILLHGLFGMSNNLAMVARELSQHFQVHLLDLRNHGRSFWSDVMSFEDMAEDIHAYLQHHQIDKAHLLGHSLGGKVAMQLALTHPECVDRLIVADIAPVAYIGNHDDVFSGIDAIDVSTLNSRRDAEPMLAQYITDPGIQMFILKNLYRSDSGKFDWRFNIKAIRNNYERFRVGLTSDKPFVGSMLFIKGELSAYIQEKHRSAIEELFPNAQLKIIQGAGHWLHAEKPVIFNRIVERFLLA